jgi:HlyD family secretion protein
MKKVILIAAAVVVLALIIGVNVRRARGKATQVTVAQVERRDLVAKVSGSGRVEARRSVSITSTVVGKVLEVAVEEGDLVHKGDLILRVDPGEREARVEQADAGLAGARAGQRLAEAELEKARFELRRAEGLRESSLASEQTLQAAKTTFDVQEARLASAREDVRNAVAALDFARRELDRTFVRADMTGVIVRLTVEEGENVLAGDAYNSGSAIVVIADLSEMEAWILVDETEVVRVKRGQPAEVTVDAFPDTTLTGAVSEVANSAYNAGPLGSQEAKDFRVRVRLQDVPEDLRPGLSARAEIVTDTREKALAVPIEALVIRDPAAEKKLAESGGRRPPRKRAAGSDGSEGSKEKEGVFVVKDGTARFAAVVTGIAGEKHFEVLDGIAEGDRIVRGPFEALRKLHTGDRVKVEGERRQRSRPSKDAGPKEGTAGADGESGTAGDSTGTD